MVFGFFISIFVRGDNKNLQIDMKSLPLIEVTELIKGIESSDNFQDDLSIADLNGDLINYEEKRAGAFHPDAFKCLVDDLGTGRYC